MERQRDGVEHVEPVALFPGAVLGEIHAERREPSGDFVRHNVLPRPPVSHQVLPDNLGAVGGDLDAAPARAPSRRLSEGVDAVQATPWMPRGVLQNERGRLIEPDPGMDLVQGLGNPFRARGERERDDTARDESSALEHGVAEFTQAGVQGQNRF